MDAIFIAALTVRRRPRRGGRGQRRGVRGPACVRAIRARPSSRIPTFRSGARFGTLRTPSD